ATVSARIWSPSASDGAEDRKATRRCKRLPPLSFFPWGLVLVDRSPELDVVPTITGSQVTAEGALPQAGPVPALIGAGAHQTGSRHAAGRKPERVIEAHDGSLSNSASTFSPISTTVAKSQSICP